MYQSTITFARGHELDAWLADLHGRIERSANPRPSVLFHVFNATSDKRAHEPVLAALRSSFPDAPYLGCTSNANIVDGGIYQGEGAVTVVCDVFEDPDTSVELMQLPLDYACQDQTAQVLLDRLAARPDVRAIEALDTVETANMPRFCRMVSEAPEHVVMFGGGALNPESDFKDVLVFSSAGPTTDHGIVFVLYAGEIFHAQTRLVQGWKPLGMPFRITRAERMTLYELNDRPALEIYNHYLHITERDNFLENGLCFPFVVTYGDEQVLRTPIGANEQEGSIELPTDVTDVRGDCRIAYGDPISIRESVRESVGEMQAFRPQALMAFACVSRLLYWGMEYAACETQPFASLASVAGFYTGGELVRSTRAFMHHNLALVLVGLREGEADLSAAPPEVAEMAPMALNLQLSLIGHMASFIGAAADELQAAYDRMDTLARTDGLTGLSNRLEVERAVGDAVRSYGMPAAGVDAGAPALVMLDLDDFKQVNDTYGHEKGDEVLRRMAALLSDEIAAGGYEATAGRWGGEEFMVLVARGGAQAAYRLAEDLRRHFSLLDFGEAGHRTMSIGVAQLRDGDTPDSLCSRVDHALYRAKEQGKNRTELDV